MTVFEQQVSSEAELPQVAKDLLHFAKDVKVFCFDAEMGSGKTTFIKVLCKVLGYQGVISSPTYSIINEYPVKNTAIYHFDLYRLKSAEELVDIGFEDYLYSNNYCFIEWPQIGADFFHMPRVEVQISVKKNIRYFRATILN